MLSLVTVGSAVGSSALSALGKIEQNWFGGASRDAARQKRVDWFVEAAKEGSVWAMRVILAGPANVASNEDPMWIKGAEDVRSARPDVYQAGVSAGGYWDSTDNDTSDKMRSLVVSELNQLGGTSLPGSIPTTNPIPDALKPFNQGVAQTIQNVTAGAGAAAANAIDPGGGYFSAPLNRNTLILGGLLLVGAIYLFSHRSK